MNQSEYLKMGAAEDQLWWYQALHTYLLRFLPKGAATGNKKALDIGCGTGGFLHKLSLRGYDVYGVDISATAAAHSHARGYNQVSVGSANELPLSAASFDLVSCIDVLEVGSVEPQKVVGQALRVLKPGGWGLFLMAAHQWLLSEHDRAVNSVRRFNLEQMRALFEAQGVQIVYSTYLFFLLFPMMALRKLLNPPRHGELSDEPISDVALPHPLINKALLMLTLPETILLPRVRLPIGTSACVVVKKK